MSADMHYETNAVLVANRIGLMVTATEHSQQTCPPWQRKGQACDHIHGRRYRVTLGRHTGPTLSFDFWGSYNDAEAGRAPTPYDILACVSSDASGPTDPDVVVEEYGDMAPSKARQIANFARRLQRFFTAEELTALRDIS